MIIIVVSPSFTHPSSLNRLLLIFPPIPARLKSSGWQVGPLGQPSLDVPGSAYARMSSTLNPEGELQQTEFFMANLGWLLSPLRLFTKQEDKPAVHRQYQLIKSRLRQERPAISI
jgi:hypothetical protein